MTRKLLLLTIVGLLILTMIACQAATTPTSNPLLGIPALPSTQNTSPTSQIQPTTILPTTIAPTTPTATVPPTAQRPTATHSWPPLAEDDPDAFRGKIFEFPYGSIRSMILYYNGTCELTYSPLSSDWVSSPVLTSWSFDGIYLYIGDMESGNYCTFLYVPGETAEECKLRHIWTDHYYERFRGMTDNQELTFGGILTWDGSTIVPEPAPTEPAPTTAPTAPSTCTPVEGDTAWGKYDGKFCTLGERVSTHFLSLYSDGTFVLHYITVHRPDDRGIWQLKGDLLYLIGVDEEGNETGHVSCFQYIPQTDDENSHLIFVKGTNDLPNLANCQDGIQSSSFGFIIKPKH